MPLAEDFTSWPEFVQANMDGGLHNWAWPAAQWTAGPVSRDDALESIEPATTVVESRTDDDPDPNYLDKWTRQPTVSLYFHALQHPLYDDENNEQSTQELSHDHIESAKMDFDLPSELGGLVPSPEQATECLSGDHECKSPNCCPPTIMEGVNLTAKDLYLPKDIKFMSGSEELQVLPYHLYDQLKAYCQTYETEEPDCLRALYKISIVESNGGGRAWFELPDTGEEMLVAKYMYGHNKQLVVVKSKAGSSGGFNGGEAAIVNYVEHSGRYKREDGSYALRGKWEVWDPFVSEDTDLPWVFRAMEGKPVAQQVRSKRKSITGRTSQPKSQHRQNSPVWGSRSRSSSTIVVADARPVRTGKRKRDASRTESNLTVREYQPTSKKDPKSKCRAKDGMGARRDEATGEILVTRKSDGLLVMLRCPKCTVVHLETQYGLKCHLKYAHDIHLADLNEVTEFCGVPVQREVTETLKKIDQTRQLSSKLTVDIPRTPTRAQAAQAQPGLLTPPNSASTPKSQTAPHAPLIATPSRTSDTNNDTPAYHFMHTLTDSSPRTRPAHCINSAHKLFAHAVAAGIAHKDTLMLTVHIDASEPLHIVRGDEGDFHLVMDAIEAASASMRGVKIYVMAEELDV